ncbi:coronin-1C-like [Styela clava]|uniref:coronin-1B-like n=1 Tax=Styela clava TaxID=7725 RepID=UPI00193954C6|nr:coronin-1B-like [Styela clava]
MSFVRTSKFRHVFGTPYKPEVCFTDLKADGTGDTNCAVSTKFLAVIKGNKIIVLPIDEPGRQDENSSSFIDAKQKPMDLAWSPHNDYLLVSGHESGDVNGWVIPREGLKSMMTQPFWEMHGAHTRKVTTVAWHPVAENIIATGGFDPFIVIWHCENQTPAFQIDVSEQPTNFAWNFDGSRLAITSKEKTKTMSLSVVDPRTGEVLTKNTECSKGTKATKVAVLKNGNILTVGAGKMADRTISLWDGNDVTNRLCELDAGCSSAVLNFYYDPDLEIFYTFGRGESVIKYYEIEGNNTIHFLSHYTSKESQKGGNFLPKRGVDYKSCEIARFFKLTTNKCEPTSFTVPRKSELFQDDIFPDPASGEKGLTADEWIGLQNCDPPTKPFQELESTSTGREPPTVRKNARKTVPKSVPDHPDNGKSNGTAGVGIAELMEDIRMLKSTVKKLSKRVTKLEEQSSLENGGEEEEEEE